HFGELGRGFEEKRVTALAKLRDHDLVARLCLFEHMGEHEKRVRRAAVTDSTREIVAHLRRIDAALLRQLLIEAGEGTWENAMRHLSARNAPVFAQAPPPP